MIKRLHILFWPTIFLLIACQRPDPTVPVAATQPPAAIVGGESGLPATPTLGGLAPGDQPLLIDTPTPDPTRPIDTTVVLQPHIVQPGESLGVLAEQYGATIEELQALNGLTSVDFLTVGQLLQVPGGAGFVGPSFKLVPDSELVYGPLGKDFDINTAVARFDGYLRRYQEEVEGTWLSGPEVVQLVANRFRVQPRLLLAALEHRAGWVTGAAAGDTTYPMGRVNAGSEGLYNQLSWAANQLNFGYYGRAEGGVRAITLADGTQVAFAADINDGTAGVQNWLGAHAQATYNGWLRDTGPNGFITTYRRLFGDPFIYTFEPVWPDSVTQPPLLLPWERGATWYFTGGPHGGWAGGSAWAALDFVGDESQLGCYVTDAWVTAMAGGVVTRSDFGAVVVDMDGDGYAGTGWAIIYMHLATRDRIPAGTTVQPGQRLGHPSCEGGFSNGTHVHVARTYNGRWIAADGPVPFVMSGWVSRGVGSEYDGILVRGDMVKEACECRRPGNAIPHQ